MLEIKNAFSKWMVRWRGRNRIPTSHAWYLENARIHNGSFTNKKWARKTYTFWDFVQAIHRYDFENKLLVIAWWSLYANTTLIWAVWWHTGTDAYTMIQHGDFVIIYSWQEEPWIYHKTHWLYRTDDAWWYQSWVWIQPLWLTDGSTVQVPDPQFGTSLTWFTIMAGTNTVTKKVLYISHPVTPSEPYRCYDYSIPSGWQDYDVWENRYMESTIIWLVTAGENVYVFCENSIEIIGRNTAVTTAWITSLSSQKIWVTSRLAYHNLACAVWDKVFFFTKAKKIMTINYTPGIEKPQIDENFSDEISDRLDLNIDSVQDYWFAYYDEQEEQVEFHLRSNDAWDAPDVVVIRDLKTMSRLLDKDMAFQYLCRWGSDWETTYAAQDEFVYIDNSTATGYENAYDDQAWVRQAITAKWHTTNIAMGNPWAEKMFQWFIVAWAISPNADLVIKCYIDWVLQFTKTIQQSDIASSESSAKDTWDPWTYSSTDTLEPFEYVADQGMLRKKWKRIRISIECSENNARFYVDTLYIDAVATGNFELNDKF